MNNMFFYLQDSNSTGDQSSIDVDPSMMSDSDNSMIIDIEGEFSWQ